MESTEAGAAGSGGGAESTLYSEDYKLIMYANNHFKSGSYEQCLETLDEIEKKNGSNSKLQHNRAVVNFYKSDCRDHATLLKVLQQEANQLGASSEISCVSPNISYNKGVIYFHRHMFLTAIDALKSLLEKQESLGESNLVLVGSLMLRLLLATNQLRKAQAFLEVLQSHLEHARNIAKSINAANDFGDWAGAINSFNHANRNLDLLTLLTNLLNRKIVVVPDDGTPEFAALKAHQLYIMKDFQMAAKQLKKIKSDSKEAVAGSPYSAELDTCIANNMGVIQLRVRHYAIAATFFQTAITFDKQIASNIRTAPLHHLSAARSCEILYNLGISMLHLRRPKEAFQCFLVPLKTYHSNPRLWLRMAEACIMDHEMRVLVDSKKPLVQAVIQEADRKLYFLKPSNKILYTPSNQSAAVPEPNLEFAVLCLRNALTLVTTYKATLHDEPKDEDNANQEKSDPEHTKNWKDVKDNNFCSPSTPISKNAVDNMLSAIYAASSYVSLRLGDCVKALEMAQKLLKAETLSDAHKLLAHTYAGEALIMMDKLTEAKPYLEPAFVTSLNAFDFETKDWQVKSLDAAQNIVRYNLAVVMALQGDCEMAQNLLNACTHPIVTAKKVSLKTYLDIRMGKVKPDPSTL